MVLDKTSRPEGARLQMTIQGSGHRSAISPAAQKRGLMESVQSVVF